MIDRINGEPVEKVSDFDALEGREIVWVIACGWCDGKHRGMLLQKFAHSECLKSNGAIIRTQAWEIVPAPRCASRLYPERIIAVSVEDVARGFVYRVVNPPREAEQERARKLEGVR